MSVKRFLIFVAWEHVLIMMMECTMSVNVKMELPLLDLVEISHVLVRSSGNIICRVKQRILTGAAAFSSKCSPNSQTTVVL